MEQIYSQVCDSLSVLRKRLKRLFLREPKFYTHHTVPFVLVSEKWIQLIVVWKSIVFIVRMII